jgi:hypothetical protein
MSHIEEGQIVKFRESVNKEYTDDLWEVIHVELSHEYYDDKYYTYTIKNIKTGEIKDSLNWKQIF